jgi:hypothetical protein
MVEFLKTNCARKRQPEADTNGPWGIILKPFFVNGKVRTFPL